MLMMSMGQLAAGVVGLEKKHVKVIHRQSIDPRHASKHSSHIPPDIVQEVPRKGMRISQPASLKIEE